MKIVQTLWSKPGRERISGDRSFHNRYGWYNKKYNYLSWALSCLQLRKFYNEVELVTDDEGYKVLITKMNLPYTNVIVELNQFDSFHEDLFGIAKIHSYSIQKQPFIHVDADFFIWERFPERLHQADLLCQSKEEGLFYSNYYSGIFFRMMKSMNYCPEIFERSILKNNGIKAINAGIIGGHNTNFFREYKDMAFDFVKKNSNRLVKNTEFELSASNLIFEQFLFKAMSEEEEIVLAHLYEESDFSTSELTDFTNIPSRGKYIHLFSGYKSIRTFCEGVEYRLRKDHPEYYYRIMSLIKNYQI